MSTNGLGHVGCRKQVTEALGKEGVVVRKAHRHTHTHTNIHKIQTIQTTYTTQTTHTIQTIQPIHINNVQTKTKHILHR